MNKPNGTAWKDPFHDYFSQADYSGPDSAKPDGLPYVNRDGWSNPDTFQEHRRAMVRLARGVGALARRSRSPETGSTRPTP